MPPEELCDGAAAHLVKLEEERQEDMRAAVQLLLSTKAGRAGTKLAWTEQLSPFQLRWLDHRGGGVA